MEDFFESLKRQSLQQTLIDTQRTLIDTLVTEFRSDQSKLHQWPNTLSAIPCTFNTSVNTTPSFKSLSLNQTNKSKGGESSNTSNSPKIPAKETEFYPSSIATWRTTEDLKKCYLEDHNIQSFFEEVTTALVKENPENPFQFIADKFKAQADEYQKYLTEKKLKRREQREITLASARKFPIGTSLHQIELTKSIDSCKSYEERRELIHQILFQSRKPQQILSQIPIDKDFLECLQYCDFISVLHTRTIVLLIPMEKYFFLEDITLLLSAVDPERLDQSLFRTDERLRILFAQDRMNLDIQDPHVNCLDITTSSQYCRLEDPPPIPLVCNFATISDFDKFNPPHSIVSLESFKKRFHWFSSGCLGNLSWKGIFVAGGCVSACLKYYPELENCESVQIEQARFTDLHLRLYKESDIDIFFYDMSSEEANQKLIAISKLFSDDEILIVRTNSAVTFCCQYPRRHVQVVLRIYKSPAEVLHCFDLASCAVGYDGCTVWAAPRAVKAFNTQCNIIDLTRRSYTYETRLLKYSLRGFAVGVPNFERARVNPKIYTLKFNQVQGLSRLLLLEHKVLEERNGNSMHTLFRVSRDENHVFTTTTDNNSDYYLQDGKDVIRLKLHHDTWQHGRIAEFELEKRLSAEEYNAVFLPWGPEWDDDDLYELLSAKYHCLNPKSSTYRICPCFFARSIEDILGDKWSMISEAEAVHDTYVVGPLKWKTFNPGAQRIGSFRPMSEDFWDTDCYLDPEEQTRG